MAKNAKKALISGITGQDGAYLAAHLLQLGYEVLGTHRPSGGGSAARLESLGVSARVQMVPFDWAAASVADMKDLLARLAPDAFYHLAAQSSIALSFEQPLETFDADARTPLKILEAIRSLGRPLRYFQASTADMFGPGAPCPQSEATPMRPQSPYGVAKLAAHGMVACAREAYGLHASSGILFNHESPLRARGFVTRKITSSLAEISLGRQEPLELGNLSARRDWCFAGDVVAGMALMLAQDVPGDYVLASGEAHSVREFVDAAATCLGLTLAWDGEGANETARDKMSGHTIVRVNPAFYRPVEPGLLCGDPLLAQNRLGWKRTLAFSGLVEMMVRAELSGFAL